MTKTHTIKRTADCDATIELILKKIEQQNQGCWALVDSEIRPTEVDLIFDDSVCDAAS
jgi:hypothetical protein